MKAIWVGLYLSGIAGLLQGRAGECGVGGEANAVLQGRRMRSDATAPLTAGSSLLSIGNTPIKTMFLLKNAPSYEYCFARYDNGEIFHHNSQWMEYLLIKVLCNLHIYIYIYLLFNLHNCIVRSSNAWS